jgi:prepilin-type N-terminal cleavage/methylation domain-containing protein
MLTPPPARRPHLSDEHGFTLIELLVSMVLGLIVTGAALSILVFTSNDVSFTTERAHVDQVGRVALNNIMTQLHSACVSVNVHPIKAGSTENELKFVSETSPILEKTSEPTSSLTTVRLRKIIYNETEHTLVEKSWVSSGEAPNYTFNETATPTKHMLLKGVQLAKNSAGETIPIFQYFRYYNTTDSIPTGKTAIPFGEINPTRLKSSQLAVESEAEQVSKVTVTFAVAPETKESSSFFKGYRQIALEDSAIFRLAPSSESSGIANLPCTQQT